MYKTPRHTPRGILLYKYTSWGIKTKTDYMEGIR